MSMQDKITKLKPVAFIIVSAIIIRVIFHDASIKWATNIVIWLTIFLSAIYLFKDITWFNRKPKEAPKVFSDGELLAIKKTKEFELELERINTLIKGHKLAQANIDTKMKASNPGVAFGANLGKFLIKQGGKK